MFVAIEEQYIVDKNGKPIRVILDIEVYQKILEALEKLEAIRAYDEAKAAEDEAIPFEQAIEEIERDHEDVYR